MKNIPASNIVMSSNALAAPAGPPLATSAVLTTATGGTAPIFVGLWGAIDLIRDPYADAAAADGTRHDGCDHLAAGADRTPDRDRIMAGALLWSGADGGLELRAAADGAHQLAGRFPYGKPAVLSDGGRTGRPRKEIIAPGAFAYRVDDPDEDIHLLVGHSFDRPLASKSAGTLKLQDTAEALIVSATITPEIARTSYRRGPPRRSRGRPSSLAFPLAFDSRRSRP